MEHLSYKYFYRIPLSKSLPCSSLNTELSSKSVSEEETFDTFYALHVACGIHEGKSSFLDLLECMGLNPEVLCPESCPRCKVRVEKVIPLFLLKLGYTKARHMDLFGSVRKHTISSSILYSLLNYWARVLVVGDIWTTVYQGNIYCLWIFSFPFVFLECRGSDQIGEKGGKKRMAFTQSVSKAAY